MKGSDYSMIEIMSKVTYLSYSLEYITSSKYFLTFDKLITETDINEKLKWITETDINLKLKGTTEIDINEKY